MGLVMIWDRMTGLVMQVRYEKIGQFRCLQFASLAEGRIRGSMRIHIFDPTCLIKVGRPTSVYIASIAVNFIVE